MSKLVGVLLCLPFSTRAFQIPVVPSHPCRNYHAGRNIFVPESLFAQSEEGGPSAGGRVRFSGADGLTTTTTNPIDAILTILASDVASIALGLLGLIVVVAHRLSLLDDSSAENLALQTRTDLLAVFACGSVLLDGITKLDVTAAMADSVVLEGPILPEPQVLDSVQDSQTIEWALESFLTATPAKSAVVLERHSGSWTVIARAGTVSMSMEVPEFTPILDRVSSPGNVKETYLPTLQALPGKQELPYLPANAQLAVLVPIIASDGSDNVVTRVLVLGSDRAKSFSPRDVAWCRIVAERIAS